MPKFWSCKINEFEYLVEYEISGKYLPATWGYWGGDPPEKPELEIIEVSPLFDVDAALSDEQYPYTKEELVGESVEKVIYEKLRQELRL